jgi:hypothetical protein
MAVRISSLLLITDGAAIRVRELLIFFAPKSDKLYPRRDDLSRTRPGGTLPMLIVRNCFVAKPGQASKLAAQLKQVSAMLPNARVLTDMTGDFNRVIMEYEAENVAAFEARMQQYASDPEIRSKMQGYTDLWVTGTREILRVV